MKAIIVDDEPKAIELIRGYLTHFNSIELVASFRNSVKALAFCADNPVELIFLDIEMPQMSGLAMAKVVRKPVHIVFTTAHAEFAAESYEVQAFDYLLKPINMDRFTKCMLRLLPSKIGRTDESERMGLRSGPRTYFLQYQEIDYLEKDGNYMVYHLDSRKILSRETIQEALAKLPEYFIRVHRSFIVNTRRIQYVESDKIQLKSATLPIGKLYKEILERWMRPTSG